MVSKFRTVIIAAIVALWTLMGTTPGIAQNNVPLEDPIPQQIQKGPITIILEPVAIGMTAPNWGTVVPGCTSLTGRLFVTDQDGVL